MSIPGTSSRLPVHPSTSFIYLHIGPRSAGKRKVGACFAPRVLLYQNSEKWEGCQRQEGAANHNAVSNQRIIKMMLMVKVDLEFMMLYQIGRK